MRNTSQLAQPTNYRVKNDHIEGLGQHFEKYTCELSCWELEEKMNTTLIAKYVTEAC